MMVSFDEIKVGGGVCFVCLFFGLFCFFYYLINSMAFLVIYK